MYLDHRLYFQNVFIFKFLFILLILYLGWKLFYFVYQVNRTWLLLTNVSKFCKDAYDAAPERSVDVFYYFGKRAFLIRHPMIIQQLLSQTSANKFESFIVPNKNLDLLLSKSPPFVNNCRSWMQPVFTDEIVDKSMSHIFDMYMSVHESLVAMLQSARFIDLKTFMNGFSKTLLMNVVFDVTSDVSRKNDAQYYDSVEYVCNTVQNVFEPTWLNKIRQIINVFAPQWIANFVCCDIVPKDAESKFRWLTMRMMRSGRHVGLTKWITECTADGVKKELLIRQVFAFLVETNLFLTSVGSLTLFRLAQNQDVQDKVRQEVHDMFDRAQKNPNPHYLRHMVYLDMVIKETMRMTPLVGCIDNVCIDDIVLNDANYGYSIRKGDLVFISSEGIHMDKRYWHQPEVFQPNRFNKASKFFKPTQMLIPHKHSNAAKFYVMALKMLIVIVMIAGRVVLDPEIPTEEKIIDRWLNVLRIKRKSTIGLVRFK